MTEAAAMTSWTQEDRNQFYVDQEVFAGSHDNIDDRCGWLKRMHKIWKPKSYLDIACRDGYVTRCFMGDSTIVGYDINPKAIEIAEYDAKQYCPEGKAEYFCEDILVATVKHRADCVISFEFIEHIPVPEVRDLIIGMTYLSDYVCAISTPNITGKYATCDDAHINVYSEDRLKKEIESCTGQSAHIHETDDFLYAWWYV